ncbi:methyltransferase [Aureimonas altamirensis]|uniref:methyltransferase n=1 Tax=Aureimonas altamirensis TaxID=370622 RepID=UPI00203753FB|nr:methyltransferase [Aureimonas altamirensis]
MFRQRHRSGDARADRRAEYAEDYAQAGDVQAAIELMRQALELTPGWPLGRLRLGEYLERAGQPDAAATLYRDLSAEGDDDVYGAGLKLAALGRAPVPDSPPPAFVANLFDQYADRFETALVQRLSYGVPGLIAQLLEGPGDLGAVLDLGCGTGLMGEQVRARASRLDGLDLSDRMLSHARQKRIYDTLYHADLCAPPAEVLARRYDLVTAADVLIYIGDLAPVLRTVASVMAPAGRFAFSVEAGQPGTGYSLDQTLRYAHAPDYVEAALSQAGFDLIEAKEAVLRRDRGEDVAGVLHLCASRAKPQH